jgi:acetyltransferase-like isoleucine patch superfamily enzyme
VLVPPPPSYWDSTVCIGRILWRELYREIVCRLDVETQNEPVPSLRIRWLPKDGRFPQRFVSFSGDPGTCSIHPTTYIEGSAPVIFGEGVTIEEGSMLATSQHLLQRGQFMRGTIQSRPIILEDGVTIGRNSIVCGGVQLGRGCRIEPGSVVSGSIEAGAVAGGVPAKPNLTHRLKTAGVLPALINSVGAKSYLNANIVLIHQFFGPQVTIGQDSFSNREIAIRGSGRLVIGKRVFIAPRAEIDLGDAGTESIIDDDVWIGGGVTLTAPFHVRGKSILAAGCVFSGTNKRSGIWGGRPAQLIHHDTTIAHLIS